MQSFNSDHTDDSSDGDDSIPNNFNEIRPIEMQKLNMGKSNDRVAPIKNNTTMKDNLNLNGNHYDMSLLSSSESDDYSDDDEVKMLCINNNNTSSSSKKLNRKIENDFSPNTSTLSDNDPDILQ